MQFNDIAGLTMCLTKVGLTSGSSVNTKFKTAATASFCVNGIWATAVTTAEFATTTDLNTGAAFTAVNQYYGSVFVFGLKADGTGVAVQGETVAVDAAGNFAHPPEFPKIPDTMCPMGYLIVKVTGTTAFTLGSTALTGVSGITYSFKDIAALPNRPQIA